MKKLTLALLILAGCAHHRPCVSIAPPSVDKMACNIDPRSNDEVIGLVCDTQTVKKHFADDDDLKKWAADAYGACSK